MRQQSSSGGKGTAKPSTARGKSAVIQQRNKAESQRRGMATTRARNRANKGGMVESPQKPMNRGASQYMGGKNRSTNPVPKVITSGLINQKNTMWVTPQRKDGKVVKGGYLAWRNSNEGGRRGEPVTGTVRVTPGSTYYKNYHHKRMGQTGSGAAEVLSVAKYVNGRNVGSPQMTPAAQMGRAYKAKAKVEKKAARVAKQTASAERRAARRTNATQKKGK